MQRFHQFLFAISVLGLSWLGMMVVHELGHVLGAKFTGGGIQGVVLHPLAISRTDVWPNPQPAVVVWMGPIVGCVLPLVVMAVIGRHGTLSRNLATFFAGFCLIANGGYIALGSFGRVGDCGEMLRTGTPLWIMLVFGALAMPLGLYLWHGLGSLGQFLGTPALVTRRMAYISLGVLIVLVTVESVLSSA